MNGNGGVFLLFAERGVGRNKKVIDHIFVLIFNSVFGIVVMIGSS